MLADRYRLDTPLGRGGMGEVWRAWDVRLGRPVAVKVLAASASAADDAVARFRHEARIAARLSDPHTVGVYDIGSAQGRCFLVMELVTGRTLAQELRAEGPLAPARVATVAAQAAAGLAAAHRRGVVHRDIKPSNLLAGEDGSVKIADFGIALGDNGETTIAATQPGAVLGTSFYLAPETARGSHPGSAADVYALGCSLYELLTGRPPFTGEHPLAVLRGHVEDEPVPPRRLRPQTPRALNAYVLRMLAKQPGLRPTAEEVAAWFTAGAWQGEPPDAPEDAAAHSPAAHSPAAQGLAAQALAAEPAVRHTPAEPAVRHATPAASGNRPPAPVKAAPVPARPRHRRLAPAAGAVTTAAAIAAATLVFASSTADGNSPPPPSHRVSRHDSGTTAPPGAASASPADAAAPGSRSGNAPGTTPAKRTSGSTPATPTTAGTSSGAASPAPSRRSAPVSGSPTSAPRTTTTPPPTSSDDGPTTQPTPTTPPTTESGSTPPDDGPQALSH